MASLTSVRDHESSEHGALVEKHQNSCKRFLLLTLCLNGKHRCSFTCKHSPADTQNTVRLQLEQLFSRNNEAIREDPVGLHWTMLQHKQITTEDQVGATRSNNFSISVWEERRLIETGELGILHQRIDSGCSDQLSAVFLLHHPATDPCSTYRTILSVPDTTVGHGNAKLTAVLHNDVNWFALPCGDEALFLPLGCLRVEMNRRLKKKDVSWLFGHWEHRWESSFWWVLQRWHYLFRLSNSRHQRAARPRWQRKPPPSVRLTSEQAGNTQSDMTSTKMLRGWYSAFVLKFYSRWSNSF